MLLILIAAAWLAVAFFALIMCRLAALSDDSRAVAVAEWIAASYLAEHKGAPVDSSAEHLPGAAYPVQPPWPRAARARGSSGIHVN